MAKAVHIPVKSPGTGIPARSWGRDGRTARAPLPKNSRAPVQILTSTKEWLDQIIAEKNLRSYDEAIMFLIHERQQHMPSDFGVFSDLQEYSCQGED